MSSRPLVIAHRGASGYRPEHTLAAYEMAISQGADAVEPDVVLSRDGVLVVRHENELSQSTDVATHREFASKHRTQEIDGELVTGWFAEDFTWDELSTLTCTEPNPLIRPDNVPFAGTRILRLSDVLELVDAADRPVSVVLEIKHAQHHADHGFSLERSLSTELALAGWARNDPRLIIESFELSILRNLREVGVGGSHCYLVEEEGTARDQQQMLGALAPTYAEQIRPENLSSLALVVDGISVPVSLVLTQRGAELIERCHSIGMFVYTWTLRPENKFLPLEWRVGFDPSIWGDWKDYFDQVIASGVDGVFVDHPDLVTAQL